MKIVKGEVPLYNFRPSSLKIIKVKAILITQNGINPVGQALWFFYYLKLLNLQQLVA